MKKYFSIIITIICTLTLVFSGCSKKVTAEGLIKEAQENVKDVNSFKGNMDMNMEIGMEAEGEKMSMEMSMNMDMEMLQDPIMYHMDGSVNMDLLGMSMDMEMYGEVKDKEMITYVNTLGEWQKTTQEFDVDNSMTQMMEFDSFIMDGMELTLAEETEEYNGKDAYVITAEISGDKFSEVYEKVFESMSSEVGGLGSMDELGLDINSDNMAMTLTYKIYKDSHLPAEVSIATTEDSTMTMEMEGVGISFDRLDCKIAYTEFDTVENIEIPEEAKNAQEVSSEMNGDGASTYVQDEFGNFIISDDEDKTSVAITPLKGYSILEDYSDEYTLTFGLEKTNGKNHVCNVVYYMTALNDEWTLQNVDQTYGESASMYTEEYGYYDAKVSDIKTMKVGNKTVKYIEYNYKMEDGLFYREFNAWTAIGDQAVVECYLYEDDYNKDNPAITEDTIKLAIEAIQR